MLIMLNLYQTNKQPIDQNKIFKNYPLNPQPNN